MSNKKRIRNLINLKYKTFRKVNFFKKNQLGFDFGSHNQIIYGGGRNSGKTWKNKVFNDYLKSLQSQKQSDYYKEYFNIRINPYESRSVKPKDFRYPQNFFNDNNIIKKMDKNGNAIFTAVLVESGFRYEMDFITKSGITHIIDDRRIHIGNLSQKQYKLKYPV